MGYPGTMLRQYAALRGHQSHHSAIATLADLHSLTVAQVRIALGYAQNGGHA